MHVYAEIAGYVRWFDPKKGYGFIDTADGSSYFAHHAQIVEGERGHKNLNPDEKVRFVPVPTPKGLMATNIIRVKPTAPAPQGATRENEQA